MKNTTYLLFLLLLGCGPSYQTTAWWEEDEFGYEAKLYQPKEATGIFVYLTDSNELITEPTPLMLQMLSKGFVVMVPKRWGDNGRSQQTLDSYENRLKGTSNSLTKIYDDSVHTSLVLFASDFYTPVATQLLFNFRGDELWLVQPLLQTISAVYLDQYINQSDSLRLSKLWKLNTVEYQQVFIKDMSERDVMQNTFYGPHYTGFIRSYWDLSNQESILARLDSSTIYYTQPYMHPLRSSLDTTYRDHPAFKLLKIKEEDSTQYQLIPNEAVFIERAKEL